MACLSWGERTMYVLGLLVGPWVPPPIWVLTLDPCSLLCWVTRESGVERAREAREVGVEAGWLVRAAPVGRQKVCAFAGPHCWPQRPFSYSCGLFVSRQVVLCAESQV